MRSSLKPKLEKIELVWMILGLTTRTNYSPVISFFFQILFELTAFKILILWKEPSRLDYCRGLNNAKKLLTSYPLTKPGSAVFFIATLFRARVQLKSFHRSLWSSIVISRVEQSHFIGLMGQAWSFHVSRKKFSQVGIFANLETNFHLLLRTEWCRNWAKLNSISLLQSNSIYNLKTAKSPKKICYSYEKADIAVFLYRTN